MLFHNVYLSMCITDVSTSIGNRSTQSLKELLKRSQQSSSDEEESSSEEDEKDNEQESDLVENNLNVQNDLGSPLVRTFTNVTMERTSPDGSPGSPSPVTVLKTEPRIIRRGHIRGVPEPVDASGQVQLLLAGPDWWLRFVNFVVDNNPVQGGLFVFGHRDFDPPREIEDTKRLVLIPIPGTNTGAVQDDMPNVIDIPLADVQLPNGKPIDHKLINSIVVCLTNKKQSASGNGFMVFASCNLHEEPMKV